MEELKKCPFCGGEASICTDGWFYFAECEKCEARSCGFDEREEAIEAWNRRVE